MPDAIITATESTFGTISGTFSADQSTVTGTVTGVITGTLDGSVGVPGPAGPGVPAGGTAGQILQKIDGTNYNTDWVTVNFSATWGDITGTLSNQTDLQSALDAKYDASNPLGFITSAALTPYLTSATASATYQTLAGMSSYLTTSAAAASYYPLTGNPSSFLDSAVADTLYYSIGNPSGFITYYNADLAYYPLSGNPSSFLVAADIANKADIASPALTGTPTAPTASPGTDSTQIATTAFVQQEVPAYATFTTPEVNSTNTIVSPRVAMDYIMHPGRTEWLKFGSGATSGTGASVGAPTSTRSVEVVGPNAGVAGYAMAVWDTSFSGAGMLGMTRGANMLARAWNKPVWASGRGQIGYYLNNVYNGDAHSTIRVSVGGKSSVGSGPILITEPGFGWLVPGVGSALQLQVSRGNSSALTTVTSSFTPVAKQIFDWKIHSDGAGNVTLWINDEVVATTANGPTISTPESYNFYFEMVEQTASTATRVVWESLNSRLWWGV